MSNLLIYITCSSHDKARSIASAVIEKRLAACANILQPHESLYWWEGAVQNEQEVAMILKTSEERFEALKAEILKLHSYDVPCIVALPIVAGHVPFLEWVQTQVQADN